MEAMQETTLELCKNIQGCVFGYTQSDEITLVLVDYETLGSYAWYDYSVQKICSVSASMCTMYFNRIFTAKILKFIKEHEHVVKEKETYGDLSEQVKKLINAYKKALSLGAMFDSRCFNVPIDEVTNAVLFRQEDATRNSINGLGQLYFSQKELQGKNTSQIQDMLMDKYGINWNNLEVCEKRGTAVIKDENGNWFIDYEMPILKGEGRKYVDELVILKENN